MCFFGTITLFIWLCHVHIWRQLTQWWRIACDAGASGDVASIPGSGTSPGEGNGHPLQYSCLENPTDRGVWWATVHGVAKSQTWLNIYMQTCKTNSVQYNGLQTEVSCFAEDPGCHMLKGTGNLGSNRLRPVNCKERKTNKG